MGEEVQQLTDDTVNDLIYPFNYDDHPVPHRQPSWPTPSGLTEDQTREICQDAISALNSYETCNTVANVDTETIMLSCIADIQVLICILYYFKFALKDLAVHIVKIDTI